jgi:hypothetical protein
MCWELAEARPKTLRLADARGISLSGSSLFSAGACHAEAPL